MLNHNENIENVLIFFSNSGNDTRANLIEGLCVMI